MKLQYSRASLLRRMSLTLVALVLLDLFGARARAASAESPSFIRIADASPDVGTADVYVDGTKLLGSANFATVTGYIPFPSGPHKVQLALIGKGVNAAVVTQMLSVQPGLAYTVAALGTKSA